MLSFSNEVDLFNFPLRMFLCDTNMYFFNIYDNHLEHIPTLQGQELSWLERVTHIAMRVHHTKCTITHIQIDIDIHTSYAMQLHRRKVNRTLPTFQEYRPVRYRKCKTDITIPRECGLSKEREDKGYMERGTLIHCSKEEAKREEERCNHLGRSHPCPFC